MTPGLLERQRKSFDHLVDSGVYSHDFDHAPAAKAFVATVLQGVVPRLARGRPLNLLDCGCGTGVWLAFLSDQLSYAGYGMQRLCGFDLSDRMIEVAREKLFGRAREPDLRTGNVLDRQSYAFAGLQDGFDLIFTYDVVQQLPPARQIDACFAIAGALAPGGVALIFDNDAETRFGRRMALRKFLTRYVGLRLVPRYYCNATYPPLGRIQRRITARPEMNAETAVRSDGVKRALIVRRGPAGGAGGECEPGEWGNA